MLLQAFRGDYCLLSNVLVPYVHRLKEEQRQLLSEKILLKSTAKKYFSLIFYLEHTWSDFMYTLNQGNSISFRISFLHHKKILTKFFNYFPYYLLVNFWKWYKTTYEANLTSNVLTHAVDGVGGSLSIVFLICMS